MASRPSIGLPKLSRRSRILLIIAAVIILILLVGARLLDTYVNWLWFGEVGFRSVFTTQILTRIGLFFAVAVFVGGLLAISLIIAYRTRPVFVPVTGADDPLARYRSTVVQRVRLFGIGLPVIVGLIAGWSGQGDWQKIQLLLHSVPFGQVDPEFGIDIGFYAFKLPFYEWLIGWFYVGLVIAFLGAVATHYLFGGIRLAGRGGQLSGPARVHLSTVAGLFVLVYAVDYFFDRYTLLWSSRNEQFTGASYTDLNAVMPAKLILMSIAVFCAIAFFVGAFMRNLQLPAIALVLLVLSGLLVGAAWPAVLDQFSVKPNANEKEARSIDRNLVATKQAFGLTDDKITVDDYRTNTATTTDTEIRNDTGTIPNVRLLDPSILSPTFNQKEARANFYGFPDKLDIDRYTVDDGKGNKTEQEYIVAAREMKSSGLTDQQNNWVNKYMVYTHGNGFVAAPANKIDRAPATEGDTAQGGYPIFTVSDLNAINNKLHMDIPVTEPRIYFGELPAEYAIVGGTAGQAPGEYDTPQDRSYLYKGTGGVAVDGLFNRLVFAAYWGERNILFNQGISDGSKIIYNRDPRERVTKVAPWLTVDTDPYPAVVNGKILWIVDGYTTLDNYPYAQSTSLGQVTTDSLAGVPRQQDRKIGYIRNSVKATVDAYDGSVTLYGIDENDPVLKAWSSVFPNTVKPNSAVPAELRSHFRYPEDLFKVQRDLLAKYHVKTPQEFFSAQTFWDVPSDPTKENGLDSQGNAPKQPPYYVLAQAPGQKQPTFQVTSALNSLKQQFLASWISVSSDPGSYGHFTVLQLPTEGDTIPGPIQVQNQFRTTDAFTKDRTLFQNSGTDIQYGNLLTLPVGGGLLYIEPIYLKQKDPTAFPQLARVLVAYKNKVGFAATLDKALDGVFGPGSGQNTTKPGEGNTSTNTSTNPTSPGQPPPNTGAGNTPEVNAAISDITAAIGKLHTAQQGGSLADIGKAIEELDAATKKFDAAKASAASSSAAPPSSTPQSPPPSTQGGG